jgi:hypothetical protein
MSAWTREAVARFDGVRFGPGPRPVDPVIRVAEHLDRGRRVAGALPDHNCRLRLLDEQGHVVVVAWLVEVASWGGNSASASPQMRARRGSRSRAGDAPISSVAQAFNVVGVRSGTVPEGAGRAALRLDGR